MSAKYSVGDTFLIENEPELTITHVHEELAPWIVYSVATTGPDGEAVDYNLDEEFLETYGILTAS